VKQKELQSGQVGLVLLVVMGLLISLVLSVALRSLADTTLSRQERESGAAFSLAEGGIENALNELRQGTVNTGNVTIGDSTGNVTGFYTVQELESHSLYLAEGDTAQIDLTDYTGATITLRWTKKNTAEDPGCGVEGSGTVPAAIEVTQIPTTGATKRAYYNPSSCHAALTTSNSFAVSSGVNATYLSAKNHPIEVGSEGVLRVKMIYHGATLQVVGAAGSPLTTQLYLVKSVAGGGDAKQEIEVKRGLDASGSVFDYAVFAAGTIVK